MNKTAFNFLRVGLAITFIWIGVLVLISPVEWGAYIQPWALNFIPFSLETTMIFTGYLDIVTGILLLITPVVWLGALIGTMHLLIVLITAGINDVTVRDIGLMFAILALFVETASWRKGDSKKLAI